MSTICFTGHRNVKETPELKERLTKQLETLIGEGAEIFLSGMARGWDLICAAVVLEFRERYPNIKLHLILPCPSDEQTADWCDSDKAEYSRIFDLADRVEICSEHYFDGCMKVRNQQLVDLADVCVCYFNESNKRSGTGQTVRMARKREIKIINVFELCGHI